MDDYFGLKETLEAVELIDGVEYLGFIPERQPRLRSGERLLVVHNQLMRARVDDATSADWYELAVRNAGSVAACGSCLIKFPESALNEVLRTFGKNDSIDFRLPDIAVVRPERN